MPARDPETDYGKGIRAQVSEARWARVVAEADERTSFVEAVVARQAETSASWRSTAATVAPQLPWPTFVKWKRHYDERTGPAWERLLDGRVPPDTSVSDDVEMAARLLRQLDAQISVQDAQAQLTRMFDDRGKVSGSWLKRVWADAGLNRVGGPVGTRQPNETPESFHGGAGLALLAAAEAETGSTLRLAKSVLRAGEQAVGRQSLDEVVDDHADRDDRGRFTHGPRPPAAKSIDGHEPGGGGRSSSNTSICLPRRIRRRLTSATAVSNCAILVRWRRFAWIWNTTRC